ncbi:MAG: tetratricopeptide repeat protein [Dokdonella sp.]|uniref:tetratricopeptide repeat protein n=1 Tax=Dokdonella sp. TaxID=2291710 RepID=UPI003F7F1829
MLNAQLAFLAHQGDAKHGVEHAARLQREGRGSEAERLLRDLLARHPRDAAAVALLARMLLASGRADEAATLLDRFVGATFRVPADLLLLRAQSLLTAGRIEAAVPAYHEAVAASPHDGAAELGLAVALGRLGQHEAAALAARSAIGKGAELPDACFVLARALFDGGHFDEAEAQFRHVLRLSPAHVAAHTNLAELVWMRSGDAAAAATDLDTALRAQPAHVLLRIAKARLLQSAGALERGYSTLAAGLAHAPRHPDLHVAAAQLAIGFDPPRALVHVECAHRSAPGRIDVVAAHADALLALGRAHDVLAVTGEMLRHDPCDAHALALRTSAWRLLGDDHRPASCDYATLVRASMLDTPPGWPDLAAYLRDLAAALHRRHASQPQANQTLRRGTQVSIDPACATDPATRAFARAIEGPVRRYLDGLGHGADPLRRRNTGACRVADMRSVRLRSRGHHVSHVHRQGWLSSACCIELPPGMAERDGAGWVAFGECGVPTPTALPADYFIKPEPGLLVLFPSWFWHGTRPFRGNGTRLSIAFDLVPA